MPPGDRDRPALPVTQLRKPGTAPLCRLPGSRGSQLTGRSAQGSPWGHLIWLLPVIVGSLPETSLGQGQRIQCVNKKSDGPSRVRGASEPAPCGCFPERGRLAVTPSGDGPQRDLLRSRCKPVTSRSHQATGVLCDVAKQTSTRPGSTRAASRNREQTSRPLCCSELGGDPQKQSYRTVHCPLLQLQGLLGTLPEQPRHPWAPAGRKPGVRGPGPSSPACT